MPDNAPPTTPRYERSLQTYWSLAQSRFYASQQCQDARKLLQELVESPEFETNVSHFQSELSFSERHLDYLSKHPNLDIASYMSNLRLMTRIRN